MAKVQETIARAAQRPRAAARRAFPASAATSSARSAARPTSSCATTARAGSSAMVRDAAGGRSRRPRSTRSAQRSARARARRSRSCATSCASPTAATRASSTRSSSTSDAALDALYEQDERIVDQIEEIAAQVADVDFAGRVAARQREAARRSRSPIGATRILGLGIEVSHVAVHRSHRVSRSLGRRRSSRASPRQGSAEIKLGAQLVVRESQAAIFFRDGRALDTFGAGRHTLTDAEHPAAHQGCSRCRSAARAPSAPRSTSPTCTDVREPEVGHDGADPVPRQRARHGAAARVRHLLVPHLEPAGVPEHRWSARCPSSRPRRSRASSAA